MRRNISLSNKIAVVVYDNALTVNDDYSLKRSASIILADSLTKDIVLTLPSAAEYKGHKYLIKKIDNSVYTVSVNASGSDKIDGESSFVINTQWDSLNIFSNGFNWIIIS